MKKILCVLLLFVLVSMTSCSHIEDTNGPDDYRVVTIKDEDILKGINTTTLGVIEANSYINGKLNGSYMVAKLSGIIEITKYDSKNKTINFHFEITCEEGNAMIAITSDDKIVKKVEANENVNFELNNNGKGYKTLLNYDIIGV